MISASSTPTSPTATRRVRRSRRARPEVSAAVCRPTVRSIDPSLAGDASSSRRRRQRPVSCRPAHITSCYYNFSQPDHACRSDADGTGRGALTPAAPSLRRASHYTPRDDSLRSTGRIGAAELRRSMNGDGGDDPGPDDGPPTGGDADGAADPPPADGGKGRTRAAARHARDRAPRRRGADDRVAGARRPRQGLAGKARPHHGGDRARGLHPQPARRRDVVGAEPQQHHRHHGAAADQFRHRRAGSGHVRTPATKPATTCC